VVQDSLAGKNVKPISGGMKTAALVFPHQLFPNHPACRDGGTIYLIEDPLFFRQYRFHRQKLIFHRATMKRFAATREKTGQSVRYVEAAELRTTGSLAGLLAADGVAAVRYVDPCDDWLGHRLASGLARHKIAATVLPDPHFLTPPDVVDEFHHAPGRLYFHAFYIEQRKRLGLLLDGREPVGGKWSFDTENRKRLPKDVVPPGPPTHRETAAVTEARDYVRREFPDAVGDDTPFNYPTDAATARADLAAFVHDRLPAFGDYEDAISQRHETLFHSVLTPALNAGLLNPYGAVRAALDAADRVPLNSLEGFVRQVIGWREYVRVVYLARGRKQRTRNFWGFSHPMPSAFYDGTTGIDPVDGVIRKVLRTGYCHHIERLMILGNFMLLCEIAPDAVYRWFMELFIDAYDWVMVPNVYGMSQYADGGGMTTKPYLSGSAYVLKMSDYKRGPWSAVWDALYWRFIDRHAKVFAANPRSSVIVKMRDKLGAKLKEHRRVAEEFLERLHSNKLASGPASSTRQRG
jgi:deoxyribodipyrimidine photolyase-related protein